MGRGYKTTTGGAAFDERENCSGRVSIETIEIVVTGSGSDLLARNKVDLGKGKFTASGEQSVVMLFEETANLRE